MDDRKKVHYYDAGNGCFYGVLAIPAGYYAYDLMGTRPLIAAILGVICIGTVVFALRSCAKAP